MASKQTSKSPSLLALAARQLAQAAAERQLLRYRESPALFVTECIAWASGEGPTRYQVELLEQLPRRRRVAVRGPHGLGKTALAWVEAANERWRAMDDAGAWGEFTRCGVDVARSGADMSVIAMRHGDAVKELRRFSGQDTMETTGKVSGILRAHGGEAVVDVIGIGAGVLDRLQEAGLKVDPFNASERTDAEDRSGELGFVNKRSAAWWNLREMLDPASGSQIALPPDDLLTGDLTAPHWRVMSGGKIQVESKDDIKKRLGRSTDDGDAVVMAFAQAPERIEPNIRRL